MTTSNDYLDERLRAYIGKEISFLLLGSTVDPARGLAQWWGPYTLERVGNDYITIRGNHEYWIPTINILAIRPDGGTGSLGSLKKV